MSTLEISTNIISNGSKWAGEAVDSIEDLCEVLQHEPLDRTFECYGNFVCTPETDEPTRFFGNFFGVSHVFSIDTNDPAVIERLTSLIRANQQREDYLAQDEPVAAKHKAHLREVCWIYAKAAHLNRTANNGEKLVLLNGNRVRLWDMSEAAMTRFIEDASK